MNQWASDPYTTENLLLGMPSPPDSTIRTRAACPSVYFPVVDFHAFTGVALKR